MTDGMFCAKCLSQYQEILSKTRLFETGKYSKLGRTLYVIFDLNNSDISCQPGAGHRGITCVLQAQFSNFTIL